MLRRDQSEDICLQRIWEYLVILHCPSCLRVLELEAASENNGTEMQVKKEGTGNRK